MKPINDFLNATIEFDKEKHQYLVDGRVVPSATQIINKVLGCSFDPNSIYVRQAQDKGTLIHGAIEKFVKNNEEPDFPMSEFDNFVKMSNENKHVWNMSEQIIYNKINGYEYAGTLDLYDATTSTLADIKTGSTILGKKWQIQLSLYTYALIDMLGLKVDKLVVLYVHNQEYKYIELELLSREFIADILDQYYLDKPKEEVSLKCLDKVAVAKLQAGLDAIERLEEEIKVYKEKILVEMEQRNITQIKCGSRSISYIMPTQRETVDTKKIKECYPEVYADCKKVCNIKSSIRIK